MCSHDCGFLKKISYDKEKTTTEKHTGYLMFEFKQHKPRKKCKSYIFNVYSNNKNLAENFIKFTT